MLAALTLVTCSGAPPAGGGGGWVQSLQFRLPPVRTGNTTMTVSCSNATAGSVDAAPMMSPRGALSFSATGLRAVCTGSVHDGGAEAAYKADVHVGMNSTFLLRDKKNSLPVNVTCAACTATAYVYNIALTGPNASDPILAAAVQKLLSTVLHQAPCSAAARAAEELSHTLEHVAGALHQCCLPARSPVVPPPLPAGSGAASWPRNSVVQMLNYLGSVWASPDDPTHSINALVRELTHGKADFTFRLGTVTRPFSVGGFNVTAVLKAATLTGLDTFSQPWELFSTDTAHPQTLGFVATAKKAGFNLAFQIDALPLNTSVAGEPSSANADLRMDTSGANLSAEVWAAVNDATLQEAVGPDGRAAMVPACVAPAVIGAELTRLDVAAEVSGGRITTSSADLTEVSNGVMEWLLMGYAPHMPAIMQGLARGPLTAQINNRTAAALAHAKAERCEVEGNQPVHDLPTWYVVLLSSFGGLLAVLTVVLAVRLGWLPAESYPMSLSPSLQSPQLYPAGVSPPLAVSTPPAVTPPVALSPSLAKSPALCASVVSREFACSTHTSQKSARVRARDSVLRPLCASYGPLHIGTTRAAALQLLLPACICTLLCIRLWVLFVDFGQMRMQLTSGGEELLTVRMMSLRFDQIVSGTYNNGGVVNSATLFLPTFLTQTFTLVGQLVVWWVPMREKRRGRMLFFMSVARKMCAYEILWLLNLSEMFGMSGSGYSMMIVLGAPAFIGVIGGTLAGSLTNSFLLSLHLHQQPLFAQAAASRRWAAVPQPRPSARARAIACVGLFTLAGLVVGSLFAPLTDSSLQGAATDMMSVAGVEIKPPSDLYSQLVALPSATTKEAGYVITAVYVLYVVVCPVLCIAAVTALWVAPCGFKTRQKLVSAAVLLFFWAQLDVLTVAQLGPAMESAPMAKWLLGSIEDTIPQMRGPCDKVEAAGEVCLEPAVSIRSGLVLLGASALLLIVVVLLTLRYERTLFEGVEKQDRDADADQNSEWSKFVYLPAPCRCCGSQDSSSDEESEEDGGSRIRGRGYGQVL
eukprot:TRINITY_DN39172_c0_g1_i1.p1 TRINITY_DN39172_c0_g1~~TRINITY_DN39172_c0_g1_i1.p1  ORF type:complete len:1060 (+),score=356.70 TRINITY_DN39172_c0_g1_i1:75-3182(+)